jgi:ADP-ribosylglycohydrolase
MTKNKKYILGAIAGDIIGSPYEHHNVKTLDFDLFSDKSRFTDDTVLTVATMDKLLYQISANDAMDQFSYTEVYQRFCRDFPHRGYGGRFKSWIHAENPQPYNSWGNGSAMRVSPIGWYATSLENILLVRRFCSEDWDGNVFNEVLREAKESAEVTHNHPEGIKGAQATAAAVYMARTGKSKDEIKKYITETFHYNLDRKLDEIRPGYDFDVSCQGSVPEAIIAFLESTDYENAVRLAISLGGDSDTIACITGGIAEAFYEEIPEYIIENVIKILPERFVEIIAKFSMNYKK